MKTKKYFLPLLIIFFIEALFISPFLEDIHATQLIGHVEKLYYTRPAIHIYGSSSSSGLYVKSTTIYPSVTGATLETTIVDTAGTKLVVLIIAYIYDDEWNLVDIKFGILFFVTPGQYDYTFYLYDSFDEIRYIYVEVM